MSAYLTDITPPSLPPSRTRSLSQAGDSSDANLSPFATPSIALLPLQQESQEKHKDQASEVSSDEEDRLPTSLSSPSSPSPHMNRRTRSTAQQNGHTQSQKQQSSPAKHANGSSNGADMNEVEHRRKYPLGADDEASATQATRLMAREEFSLDHDPLDSMNSKEDGSAVGFLELPKKDQRAFVLLVMLYFLQVYISSDYKQNSAKTGPKIGG